MSYGSPYSPNRGGDYNNYYSSRSPSPTPSPHHYTNYYAGPKTPQRPATRAHTRGASTGFNEFRPSTAFSPRYKSTGEYATGPSPKAHPTYHDRERTDYPRYDELPPRSATRVAHHSSRTHGRHASTSVHSPPARPQTTKPTVAQKKKATAPAPKATEADARKHKIPAGYSLKNWDPTEEPVMLLGSVFDANSLGKWVYDWTVYRHGAGTPIADMAGELWLLLIQLSGKIKRSEEIIPEVRTQENKEMLEDFIESGERLMDKLRSLLKRCEAPMLQAAKRKGTPELGKNSGVEFVETMFGRERELEKTERFMQSVRLWNLRFDANCEIVLKRPTA